MSFNDVQFPPDVNIGPSGGPGFLTTIQPTAGGHEQRNMNWSKARCSYDVAYAVKTQILFEAVLSFFYSMGGRAQAFRFKDWSDYRATGEIIGTGTASPALDTFQLIKTYTFGSLSYVRTITKPVEGTLTVYVDGVEQVETTDYIVDYDTGIIVFNDPIGAGDVVTADFEFDVPCRFDTDKLTAVAVTRDIISVESIPLVEVREK